MAPYHRPMLRFTAVLLLALAAGACSPTFNWREVRVEPTSLKAMLPCKPDKGRRRVDMGEGPLELSGIGCETGGATFAVLHAELADPAGAAVGAWQTDTFPGFLTRAEENAPAWFETLTTRYDDAVAFYREAFGWETHVIGDTAEFRYTTLGLNENARAGIMDASGFLGDLPARWQFYLQVADTDESVAKAVSIGAEVVAAAEGTPYGRIATLIDPAGVQFCVLGPNLA